MDAHNDPLYFPHHPDFHLAFSTLDPRKHVPGDTVFVCNPPRERPWPTIHAHDPFALTCTDDDPDLDFYRTLYVAPPKMPKTKRRSVQSVLVPTFLQGSSSRPTSPDRDSFRAATPTPTTATPAKRSSRIRAHSSAASIGRWSLQVLGPPAQQQQLPPSTSTSTSTLKGAVLSPPTSPPPPISSDRDSPPPDFLLDDDPFANLTAAPVVSRASTPTPTAELPVPPTPRSPLMTVEEEEGLKETVINPISLACASSADKLVFKPPAPPRAFSTRMLPVAAHQRPAFSSRPSLPSLSTLAQMNVVLTKKVRKGRVGAGLPFEPWDNPTAELPPRVLQDIHASSTASLPAGTQPLLPSQIVGIATGAAAASNGNSNSHNYGGGDNLNAFSGPSNIHYSTPSTLSTTTLRPSMLVAESSHAALQDYEGDDEDSDTIHAGTTAATTTTTTTAMSSAASSDSGHGSGLLDSYYSTEESSSDPGHEGQEHKFSLGLTSDEEEELDEGSSSSFALYRKYQQYTSDFEDMDEDVPATATRADTTTPVAATHSGDEYLSTSSSASAFSFSPPTPSSRSVSERDLLSTSVSSTSSSSEEVSAISSSTGHGAEVPWGATTLGVPLEEEGSRLSAVVALEDELRARLDGIDPDRVREVDEQDREGESERARKREERERGEREERESVTTMTTRSSSEDSEFVRSPPDSVYNSSSALLGYVSSPVSYSLGGAKPFGEGEGEEEGRGNENERVGLVESWRDQFGFGGGGGSFLSDLELSEPFLESLPPPHHSHAPYPHSPPATARRLGPPFERGYNRNLDAMRESSGSSSTSGSSSAAGSVLSSPRRGAVGGILVASPRRGGVFDEELDYPNGTNASIDASWNYGDNTTNDANWGGDEDTNNNNLHLSFDALKSAMEGAGVWPSSADTVRPAASLLAARRGVRSRPDSRGGFADEGELGGDGLGGDEPAIGAGDDSERVGAADVVGKVVEEGGAVEETEGWGADLEKGWTEGGDGDGVGVQGWEETRGRCDGSDRCEERELGRVGLLAETAELGAAVAASSSLAASTTSSGSARTTATATSSTLSRTSSTVSTSVTSSVDGKDSVYDIEHGKATFSTYSTSSTAANIECAGGAGLIRNDSTSSAGSADSVYREHQHDDQCYRTTLRSESPSEADLDLELEMLRYQPPRVSAVSMRGESSVVDGGGREASGTSGSGSGGYRARSQSHSTQEFGGYGAGGGGRWNTGGYGRGRGGGGEEDGDGDEERRRRGLQRGPEAYTGVGARQRRRGESEDEEDDERVDAERYGFAPPPNVRARTVPQSPNVRASASSAARFPCSSSGEDDDDVPLAQRIPGALTAQKSIRRQVREERQVKRLERAATGAARGGRGEGQYHPGQVEGGGFTRDRHATLRPAGAGGPSVPLSGTFSSSQEAAMYAAAPAGVERRATTTTRKRTNTMPSKAQNPFSAEDLAMRLQIAAAEQQGLASAPVASGHQHFGGGQFGVLPSRGASTRTSFEAGAPATGLARGRTMKEQGSGQHYTLANPPASASATTTAKAGALRLMRSFTRDKSRAPVEEAPPAYQPLPSEAEYRSALQRHVSRSQSRVRERGEDLGMQRKRSVSVSRAPGSPHAHGVEGGVPPVPPLPSGSVMDDQQQGQGHAPRKLWKVGRASHEGERPGTGAGRSPVVQVAPLPVHAGPVVQQRFFVGDMQRFHMVEITGATTAGEVVDVIEAQGGFKGLEGAGGWMVYEVAQDFGMERPIRSFELLADVQASWNKDKMVNLFVLKNTPLALPLSRNAIPASSPTYSGYIEWEVKRGKWSKRWLQLREHSLWLSKREGKEEVLLCSLSNFDAYFISRAHRAPKPFAFAVKSTDSLTFFENAADYVHNFSCNESNGRVWMEKILIARSYVLQQERQILFNPKAVGGNASGGLSRAPTTRKSTSQRPAAPLVSVPPLVFSNQAPPQRDKVFEPGSLLHGQL